jgi:hypothetical protein
MPVTSFNTPPPSPLRSLKRARVALTCASVPALATAAIWALAPLKPGVIDLHLRPTEVGAKNAPTCTNPIDPHLFAVNLWNAPPPPTRQPEQAASAPAPAPLNLQLIGIITEGPGDTAKAALYDVDHDRLLIVADGGTIRDQTVHIASGGVELTDGRTTRRLLLRPDKGASS